MKLTLSVFALFFLSLKAYSDTGKWEYSAEMDPLTGKDNIIVFLRPESIFSYTENTVLAVSCQREKTHCFYGLAVEEHEQKCEERRSKDDAGKEESGTHVCNFLTPTYKVGDGLY